MELVSIIIMVYPEEKIEVKELSYDQSIDGSAIVKGI